MKPRVWSCLLVACGVLSACVHQDNVRGKARITVEGIPAFRTPVLQEVHPGDTIETICRRLAGRDWVMWRDALSAQIDPKSLKPGLVFKGRLDAADHLESLGVRLDLKTAYAWRRENEKIAFSSEERPVTGEILRIEGVIESSLFESIDAIGAHPELAVRLASVFQWDIDFFRGLRKGDHFTLLVEEERVDGQFFAYGTLYGARFFNGDRCLTAIAYADENGRIGYYDLDGNALQKQFLRSPLKFSRITSPFSLHRFHPVLHRRMPHYGVDYGAPVGTPVHATADGIVTFVGTNGGAGRMVRIRHANGYETNYLHLSRYGRGIRRGVRVSQKQIIGYVGATGLATGPHLDYRVKLNGRWINPMSISSPPVEPISKDLLNRFLAHALAFSQLLDGKDAPPGARC